MCSISSVPGRAFHDLSIYSHNRTKSYEPEFDCGRTFRKAVQHGVASAPAPSQQPEETVRSAFRCLPGVTVVDLFHFPDDDLDSLPLGCGHLWGMLARSLAWVIVPTSKGSKSMLVLPRKGFRVSRQAVQGFVQVTPQRFPRTASGDCDVRFSGCECGAFR